jgi:hypothetical protein
MMKRLSTRSGRSLRAVSARYRAWNPRRPRLVGALLAVTGGVMITGAGVLITVLHNAPDVSLLGYVTLVLVSLGLLLFLGMPSEKRMLGLCLLWVLLLLLVPAGFRSAVLDWRGEHVRATITEVRREDVPRTGGVDYACKAVAQGRVRWLRDSDRCGRDTRPGDRYEIVRDPDDLVGASTTDRSITFSILLPVTGAVLLLMAAIGAGCVRRSSRTAGVADAVPAVSG